MIKSDKLQNYVSEDGLYLIPVEWSVYSTIKVAGASNLQEAIEIAEKNIDDIPTSDEWEYIDDTYKLNIGDSDEEIIAAQDYVSISSIIVNKNGKITS